MNLNYRGTSDRLIIVIRQDCWIAARKLLSRPPHRKRSERGRASGSEGVCFRSGVSAECRKRSGVDLCAQYETSFALCSFNRV